MTGACSISASTRWYKATAEPEPNRFLFSYALSLLIDQHDSQSNVHCAEPVYTLKLAACAINHPCARAHAPSWGRASASAGFVIYAGNHQGMPCTPVKNKPFAYPHAASRWNQQRSPQHRCGGQPPPCGALHGQQSGTANLCPGPTQPRLRLTLTHNAAIELDAET